MNLTKEDLIAGEVYYHYCSFHKYIFRAIKSYDDRVRGTNFVCVRGSKSHDFGKDYSNTGIKELRKATLDEIEWLKACEKADKFIPRDEALKKSVLIHQGNELIDEILTSRNAILGMEVEALDNSRPIYDGDVEDLDTSQSSFRNMKKGEKGIITVIGKRYVALEAISDGKRLVRFMGNLIITKMPKMYMDVPKQDICVDTITTSNIISTKVIPKIIMSPELKGNIIKTKINCKIINNKINGKVQNTTL